MTLAIAQTAGRTELGLTIWLIKVAASTDMRKHQETSHRCSVRKSLFDLDGLTSPMHSILTQTTG